VTPEGHPFYSLGVNSVNPSVNQTYVAGREWMFESLPKPDEPLASYYGEGDNRGGNGADQGRAYNAGRWYDFYGANLQRLYGEPCAPGSDTKAGVAQAAKADAVEATAANATEQSAAPAATESGAGVAEAAKTGAAEASVEKAAEQTAAEPCKVVFDERRWASHTLDRLQAWGFNTLGNWSAPVLATLTEYRTPCHCRSSAITPASAPAPIGGAVCPIRSIRVSPWPPSAPWPSPPATIATIRG